MNRDERIVVVGAGLTGLRAAERLRELKFDGEVIILGDERLPPYHRPALSKQLLMGTLRPSDLTLPAYEDIGAKWRFGTPVRYLLPRNRTLQLPGGEEITYDGLVIATGVEARRPNNIPYHDPRVLVLRTMPDAMDLERVINSTKGRVAVVGGGFTGCEIAASLRHMSRDVTLIGRADNLLGSALGPELGAWLTNLHRDHGVDLALGNSVRDWAPVPEGIGLRLTDGSTMLASCVVVAAGTVPTTAWLRGSGLPLDNGVVCDATCHVVGADDIVAAGDVAQWPNLRFDNEPRRVEHWLNAIEMGRAAAESLMAGRAAAEPFTPMPRFWTEQYGVRIQAAGMPKLGNDVISLGKPDEGTGTVYGYSRDGRLMGVVGLDCPSSVLAWTESVSRQNPVPRQRAIAAASAPKQITAGPAEPEAPAAPGKRRAGRHQLPVKGKQPAARRTEIRQHDIGYVDTPSDPTPMETSGPVRQVDGEVAGPLEVAGRVGGGMAGPASRVGGPVSSAGAADSGMMPRVGGGGPGWGAGNGYSGQMPRVGGVDGGPPPGGAFSGPTRAGGMDGGPPPDGAFSGPPPGGAGSRRPAGGAMSGPMPSVGGADSGMSPRVGGGDSGVMRAVGGMADGLAPGAGSGPMRPVGGGDSGPLPALAGPVRPSPPGWGHPVQVTGPVPPVPAMPSGRAQNVVDSFSRMLPVAVRPPARRVGGRPPAVPQSGYLGQGGQPGRHGPDGGFGRSERMSPADRHPSSSPPRPPAPPLPPTFGGYDGTRPAAGEVGPPAVDGYAGGRSGRFDEVGPPAGDGYAGRFGEMGPPAGGGYAGTHSGRFDEMAPPAADGYAGQSGEVGPAAADGYAGRAGDVDPPAFRGHDGTRPVPNRAGQVRPPVFGGREETRSVPPVRRAGEVRPPTFGGPAGAERRPGGARGDARPPAFRAAGSGPRHQAGTSTDQLHMPAPVAGRLDPADVRPVELTSQLPVIEDEPYERAPRQGRPERRPRHARPEDHDYEPPRQRPGPEDSYDRMPAVDRPVRAGGGRRRRA